MIWLIIILLTAIILFWIYRFYIYSFLIYLSVRFEHRQKDFQLLSSLRDSLVHERKKKIAGLEMILSSWERGDEIQPKYEYFEELLGQLKELVQDERRNLMAVTSDIFLWSKLWRKLVKIERISKEKKERVEKLELRNELKQIQNLLDQVIDKATEQFSFTLNQVVAESLKIVRVEKTHVKNIEIHEQLDMAGDSIRFSYNRFKDWQRILTNLIRNAVDAVEIKHSAEGVVSRFIEKGEQCYWVRISTKLTISEPNSISICIEDSGIGMDEATRASFYKKGFTYGKEGGLGLGVSEESVQFINQYGGWEIESQKGIGTKININIDKQKAQKAELILPPSKPFYRTKLAYGLFILALALIGLTLLFIFDKYSRFWVDWNPASMRLRDKNTVIVEAKDGRFLWDKQLFQRVHEPCLALGDVDGDGTNEVLIGTTAEFNETGHIYCFSYKGRELWKFDVGANAVFGNPSNLYTPSPIIIRDLDLDGKMEIVTGGQNVGWFAHQIAVLDIRGNQRWSYWHSGSVAVLLCEDMNNDTIPEIVFGGVNNRLDYSAVLGILDYRTIDGQSPPYAESALPKGHEKTYIKFPFVRGLGGKNLQFSNVVQFLYTGKEQGSNVYLFRVVDDPGLEREFYLDSTLTEVLRIIVPPASIHLWQQLKKEGIVDYDLTPDVIESWKQIEVWKNGIKVK
jgi:signal transduction histidine kinase